MRVGGCRACAPPRLGRAVRARATHWTPGSRRRRLSKRAGRASQAGMRTTTSQSRSSATGSFWLVRTVPRQRACHAARRAPPRAAVSRRPTTCPAPSSHTPARARRVDERAQQQQVPPCRRTCARQPRAILTAPCSRRAPAACCCKAGFRMAGPRMCSPSGRPRTVRNRVRGARSARRDSERGAWGIALR